MNIQDGYNFCCLNCQQSCYQKCNYAVFSGEANVPCLVEKQKAVFVRWCLSSERELCATAVGDHTADTPLAISRTQSHSGTVGSPPLQRYGSVTPAWRCPREKLPVLWSRILKSMIRNIAVSLKRYIGKTLLYFICF